MIPITSAYRGTTVVISLEVYDADGNRADADATPTICIRMGDTPYLPSLISNTDMTRVDLGEYQYLWDTTGIPVGEYHIVCNHAIDGIARVTGVGGGQGVFTIVDEEGCS